MKARSREAAAKYNARALLLVAKTYRRLVPIDPKLSEGSG
jgi:hypothetical protein